MNNSPSLLLTYLLSLALIGGCSDQKADTTATIPNPVQQTAPPEAVTPPKSTPTPVPPTVTKRSDPISAVDLKAGLDAMMPRIVAKVDAYQKIGPREDMRLTMHPDETKNAVVEFNVERLNSLTLSAFMGDFSKVPDCEGNPDAGIAQIRWSLDGAASRAVMVDRNYASTIDIELKGAKRLKVEVDKGNRVHWCDWLGLGLANVK